MKLTEDTVNKLEYAFSIGADVSAACYYANISRQTYYNWEKSNTELKDKFDRLKEKPVLESYKNTAEKISAGDVEISKWYLERKRKDEFSTREEHENKEVEKFIDELENYEDDPELTNQKEDKLEVEQLAEGSEQKSNEVQDNSSGQA